MNKYVEIKSIREELLLTQAEFAKLMGVSKQTVSCWENGRQGVSFAKLRKLREILNVYRKNKD